MGTESLDRKKSLFSLFRIFIKTSRNRVILTLICGVIIFVSITCFSLFAYNYRYDFYTQYFDENENYLNDGFVSVVSSRNKLGRPSFNASFIDELEADFSTIVKSYFPNLKITNTTSMLSAQLYESIYVPYFGWDVEVYKLTTLDEKSYSILNTTLIEGRLPQNASEVALLRNRDLRHNVNDSVVLYGSEYLNHAEILTVVGIVEIDELAFINANVSVDVFNYDFSSATLLHDYSERETFLTNFTCFSDILAKYTYYIGLLEFLVDMEFDCDAIRISKIADYLVELPRETSLPISPLINYYVLPCDDLNDIFLGYIDSWIAETIQLMALNIPLLILIGLITGVVLNIGAKNLESAYRRMKLHGLSYNNMRAMILLENSSFSILSLLSGVGIGFGINFSIVSSRSSLYPPNYFVDFLQEPLLLLLIGTYFLGFIFMSYYIQNAIAKKASETISEEFKIKRTKFKKMFSTNEFRLFTFALIIALVSIVLYFQFQTAESESVISMNFSYVTIFWFSISCCVAMLLVFVLLIIARLITLLWTFISKLAWKRNINIGSLSIKHLTVSKKTYQLALLTALIFGVLVLPTAGIDHSVRRNLIHEANLNIGTADLAVVDWTDPEEKRDYIFDDIEEIVNYTEITYYQAIDYYGTSVEPATTLNLVAIENPETLLKVMNYDLIKDRSWDDDDVLSIRTPGTFLLDKKTSRKLDFKPGNSYYTKDFTRHYQNYTIKHSYNYFPCTPIPKKSIFETARVVYTFLGSEASVKTLTKDLDLGVGVRSIHFKLIKAVNESSIPIIKEKLLVNNFLQEDELYTLDDMVDKLYSDMDTFSKGNLLFYSILIFIVLAFVGYFTGLKAFEERVRIVEVLYRVGSEREKILGIFMFENGLINILPILIAMLVSLPIMRIVETYVLGLQETFYPFKSGIAFWFFIVIFFASIVGTSIGWLISMIPQLKRYRPVKQE